MRLFGNELARERRLVGRHELCRSWHSLQADAGRTLAEITANLPGLVQILIHVRKLDVCHFCPHASSHDAREPFSLSTALPVASPLSTTIDPSWLTMTRFTRSPALSAALTARRTWACVKPTARVIFQNLEVRQMHPASNRVPLPARAFR